MLDQQQILFQSILPRDWSCDLIFENLPIFLHPDVPATQNYYVHCYLLRKVLEKEYHLIKERYASVSIWSNAILARLSKKDSHKEDVGQIHQCYRCIRHSHKSP